MKHAALIVALCVLLGGCARKSELEKARAELAEAQKRIEQLEVERIPRSQYDVARASLRIADDRISTLEKNLNAAYDLMAAQQPPSTATYAASTTEPIPAATANTPPPSNFRQTNGSYVVANDTHVYSAESELELGQHLKVSSPTGLMVTDTEQRVVGGDLAIKSKGMTMTSANDLLVLVNTDGTVRFTGTNLTMKFDEKKEPNNPSPEANPPASATAQPAPQPPPAAPDTPLVSSSTP